MACRDTWLTRESSRSTRSFDDNCKSEFLWRKDSAAGEGVLQFCARVFDMQQVLTHKLTSFDFFAFFHAFRWTPARISSTLGRLESSRFCDTTRRRAGSGSSLVPLVYGDVAGRERLSENANRVMFLLQGRVCWSGDRHGLQKRTAILRFWPEPSKFVSEVASSPDAHCRESVRLCAEMCAKSSTYYS